MSTPPAPPLVVIPNHEIVPACLRAMRQWVAWWSVYGKGNPERLPNGRYTKQLKTQPKPHKLPINPRTGGLAATNRPQTWSSYERACDAANKWQLSGIGFVFTSADPHVGIDIDNCRDLRTGVIAGWAWVFINALDSYTEVSPSGTGVHTIISGALPVGKGNQAALNGGKVEMFSTGRYFTVSGVPVPGTPAEVHDRQEALSALHGRLFAADDKVRLSRHGCHPPDRKRQGTA